VVAWRKPTAKIGGNFPCNFILTPVVTILEAPRRPNVDRLASLGQDHSAQSL
jgi:hypothetical protein